MKRAVIIILVLLFASSPVGAEPVTFTKLTGLAGGRPAGTAVYRADLSQLGLTQILSITIKDNSGGLGGARGRFSGFDLDAIALSEVHISDAGGVGTLAPLAVFDSSPAGTLFTPGVQRPPVDPKLFGTDVTGNFVDSSVATLGLFDANSTTGPNANGFVSMGDNGVLSFNLTSAVATFGLFLYIGEVGDNGEVAAGSIEVSDTPVPTPEEPDFRLCPAVGLPVSVTTGNVYFDQIDIEIPGLGPGLRFVRSYNSKNASSGGVFGPGWTHRYEQKIRVAGATLTFRGGDGVPSFFSDPDGDGTYEASVPFSKDSSIAKVANGYDRHFRTGGHETYDSEGRLTSLVDPVGNTVTLIRDASGRLTDIIDPAGRTLALAYTGEQVASLSGPDGLIASYGYSGDLLQSITYPDGSGFTFTYNGSKQLLTVTDHSGRTLETHTYSGDKALTSEISDGQDLFTLSYTPNQTTVSDALGNVTSYEWSVFGGLKRVTRVSGPCSSCGGAGETREWTYDERSRVLTYKDGLGQTTSYAYDGSGDLLSETDPLFRTTAYTRDAAGRLVTQTDALGAVTTWTHGPAGVGSVTDPLSRRTTLTYGPHGAPISVTDPRGKTTGLAYDSAGNLASITDPLGNLTSFSYDALGRRIGTTDPLGNVTSVTHDPRGRVVRIANPDLTHTDFTYDLGGRRTSVTDALGRTTSYAHDPYGRLEAGTDPLGGITSYGYDAMSRLVSLTDPQGKTTSFAYDSLGRLAAVSSPGGLTESLAYDTAGRLLGKTDRNGVLTTYEYDAAGQLMKKVFSDGTSGVAYTYDAAGRLTSAQNGTDSLSWTHDLAGQLLSETSAKNASTVAYTYDGAGNRLSLRINGSLYLTYAYDEAARLTSISRGSKVFSFAYDDASRRTSMAYPNGVVTTYRYDVLSRLTRLKAGLEVQRRGITDLRYTYDAVGSRLGKTGPRAAEQYEYDLLDRLKQVTALMGRGERITEAYTYDALGNRLSSLVDSAWSYGDRNELTSNETAGFAYDANGNLIQKFERRSTWTYEWNAESQLTRVLRDGAEVARLSYDSLGRRVEKTAGGITRRYLYDGEDILQEEAGGRVQSYVHGPEVDEPLGVEGLRGRFHYYHADGLGSIVGITDSRGKLRERFEYEAFGSIERGRPRGYAFTGREWDAETRLYYYRARYYDPKIGRFISEDPIGFDSGDPNFYAYVENNPVSLVDPEGLQACIIIGRIPPIIWMRPPPVRLAPNQTHNPGFRMPKASPPRPYVPVQQPLPPPPPPPPPPVWWQIMEELFKLFDPTPPAVVPPAQTPCNCA